MHRAARMFGVAAAVWLAAGVAEARFLQTDPVGYDAGMNLYAYVGNDPLNMLDSDGKQGAMAEAVRRAQENARVTDGVDEFGISNDAHTPVMVLGGTGEQVRDVTQAVGNVLATQRGQEWDRE